MNMPDGSSSDYRLHHAPGQADAYRREPPIRWSDRLRRWLVFDPDLIRAIMKDQRFSVPNYAVEAMEQRFDLDFPLTRQVTEGLPLACEGERHRQLRKAMSLHLQASTAPALVVFEDVLRERIDAIEQSHKPCRFCLYRDLLREPLLRAVFALAELPAQIDLDVEILSQHFDDAVSLRKRLAIETMFEKLGRADTQRRLDPAMQLALGVLTVSTNTLPGSMALSLHEVLSRSTPPQPLNRVDWDPLPPRTSLALIERLCLADTELAGVSVRAGDRLRLFIETDGFSEAGEARYSELFFAVGAHKCVGMPVIKQVWTVLTRVLAGRRMTWEVDAPALRRPDSAFNFPEQIMVTANA